jgi:hypothetical protein
LADVTPHDLRRTFITNLTRVTSERHIGKFVANQTLQGVGKTYNLFAFDDEKRDALKKWSELILEIVDS